MYRAERIFVVSALFLAGLGLVVALGQGFLGSEGLDKSGLIWLMGSALVLLATVGARWAGTIPGARRQANILEPPLPVLRVPSDVVVPALLAAGAVLFLQLFDNAIWQAFLVLLAGGAFGAVLWAQAHSRDIANARFALSQSILNVISHLTAFLLFSVIYGLKVQSRISATAVAIVTVLLLLELLARDEAWHKAMDLPVESHRSTLGFLALSGGLVAGELTWALNYWAALSALVGGAFLLVVFYVVHGIIVHYVDRKLTWQVFLEFGTVGAIALAVIFGSAFL
jgi:Protein of unknown function (DUF5656)